MRILRFLCAGIDPARFKIIRMEGVQIRALIGKGGETIKEIRLRSGADIKIDHLPSDPEGNVTIVGEVEKTEAMIKEALQTKGCPLLNKPGAAVAQSLGRELSEVRPRPWKGCIRGQLGARPVIG